MANSVDPDKTPHSVASHMGLHCLLRPVCPIHVINMDVKYLSQYTFCQEIGGPGSQNNSPNSVCSFDLLIIFFSFHYREKHE